MAFLFVLANQYRQMQLEQENGTMQSQKCCTDGGRVNEFSRNGKRSLICTYANFSPAKCTISDIVAKTQADRAMSISPNARFHAGCG